MSGLVETSNLHTFSQSVESEPEGIQTSTLGMEQIWYHTLADKRQMALKAILDTYEHLFQDEVIVPRHYHLLKVAPLNPFLHMLEIASSTGILAISRKVRLN